MKLKERRDRLGWTQAKMAEELGVRSNTYARYERGELPLSGMGLKLLTMLEARAASGLLRREERDKRQQP